MLAPLHELIAAHGYWVIALLVGLESVAMPLPGETALVMAAVYAEETGGLNALGVVVAAAAGAIAGGSIAYWLGRQVGLPLLLRYSTRIGIGEPEIKLGRYLFDRHGGKIIFLGRFVALLRMLTAVLAGVNRLAWPRFFFVYAAAALLWSALFGFGGFFLGRQAHHLTRPLGVATLVVSIAAAVGVVISVRRYQAKLLVEAERAYPGPLTV